MILLNTDHYYKAEPYLKALPFNKLFAQAVIDKRVAGRVYADEKENPETFYIIHSYGMSLLMGNTTNEAFNTAFKAYALNTHDKRNNHEWVQIYPAEWEAVLKDLFQDKLIDSAVNIRQLTKGVVERNTRVNFRFNHEKYSGINQPDANSKIKIIQHTQQAYNQMTGSVVPRYFWDSADDFKQNGIAYCLYYEQQLAATAFSSFVEGNQLELGIETVPQFRGKGLAQKVCAALIDYCLANNLEPIWACRLENTGSYVLAQKLGFEPALLLPYYRI
ncbi:GNAT family N-acetyltransferase [Emticicia sp. BO119]|uniref:GNAT family N-acetyltransferase n=1 Tax=Emticicia sp. BO119 TaxID=2757768 RepID=UPI0015F06F22|nr:GNAT family N-acetyltransferase [Emticicia sp. BO119]MBA4853810.1 GNAT family N-acetyltransferase [Emticicia sp. BO119]